jgi:hypothetical protein
MAALAQDFTRLIITGRHQGRAAMTSYKFNPFALDITDAVAVPSPIPQDTRAKLVDGVVYRGDAPDDIVTKTDLAGVPEGALVSLDNERTAFHFYQYYEHLSVPYVDWTTPNYIDRHVRHADLRDWVQMQPSVRHKHYHEYYVTGHADFSAIYSAIHWFLGQSPWTNERRIMMSTKIWCEHLPRISEKFPGMLAYYQSPAKRARGILTPIKPGRYLNKFFSHLLTGEEINKLAVRWEVSAVPPELTITQDADEIEAVYENAYLSSCMCFKHKGAEWFGKEHPARIYAGPDLGVAYLGPKENPVARVLVWPERKIFLFKAYGDTYRIKDALKAKGYTEAMGDDFEGAAVRRIPYRDGMVVAPYLDACEYLAEHPTDDNLLVLSDDDGYLCQNTSGISDRFAGGRERCAITGDRYPRDEMYYIEGEDIYVGEWALNEYFVTDFLTDHYIREEDAVELAGRNYTRHTLADNSGVYYCDHNEEYYLESEFPSIETADGQTISSKAYRDDFFTCDHDGEIYPDSYAVELSDGRMVHETYKEELEAELAASADVDVAA